MSFERRREILFVYGVKDANPNGDPLNANHPRYDEGSGQILVSDVRLKRTIRDQWLREGKDVLVDGETKTLKARVDELRKKFETKNAQDAISKCIDARLFGVTFASEKESFSWTGPVQFKWGRSLHKAKAEFVQGTAAFATSEGSNQRSFRNEYIVPFVLIGAYAIANQYPSEDTGATEEDVDSVGHALWNGTVNLITRSKVGHAPLVLMEVIYAQRFEGAIGAFDEKIRITDSTGNALTEDEQLALRSITGIKIDLTSICRSLQGIERYVEQLRIWHGPEVSFTGLDLIRNAFGDKVLIEKR